MAFISHVESPLNNFRWGGGGGRCVFQQGNLQIFVEKKE